MYICAHLFVCIASSIHSDGIVATKVLSWVSIIRFLPVGSMASGSNPPSAKLSLILRRVASSMRSQAYNARYVRGTLGFDTPSSHTRDL